MAKEDYKGIWVFAEQQDGVLNPAVLEILAKALELKAHTGEELTAVLLGDGVSALAGLREDLRAAVEDIEVAVGGLVLKSLLGEAAGGGGLLAGAAEVSRGVLLNAREDLLSLLQVGDDVGVVVGHRRELRGDGVVVTTLDILVCQFDTAFAMAARCNLNALHRAEQFAQHRKQALVGHFQCKFGHCFSPNGNLWCKNTHLF